ncbi:MAG: acyl-CoA dehydrogenase type 2 [Rhizorhabdus sp.]|nr:acyl-CoA dehydrogenase type 2 [Rhizorhabdus sp.]
MHGSFQTVGKPAAVELAARVQALLPAIASRTAQADRNRDLPAETVAEIKAAGLFRSLQPAAWGGMELDPRIVLDIQNMFAEVCASTAWIYGVLSVQAFVLARFGAEAQADVWGADQDALVSSSFQPVGKVVPVDGGFRLSGRFTFSSGSSHCGWALLGGIVPPGDGRDKPEMRLFLVPRANYAIEDTWHVIGLRGTGSNDIIADNVFVPEHRTYKPDSGLQTLQASSGLPALYRLPWMHVFTSMISNLGVGAARGALATFVDVARTRASVTNAPSRENPAFLSAMARTLAELDMLDLVAKRNFGNLLACVEADAELPLSEGLLYRSQLTGSMRKIASLVDEMMLLLGARGIRSDAPLTRVWLDLSTARAHAGNDPTMTLGQLAGEMIAGR